MWKVLLAVLSTVLASSVWFLGLIDSLGRPSVAPALSLEQQELAVLAEPALAPAFRPLLVGQDPEKSLLETLRDIPLDQLSDRQQLLFATLETDQERRETLLSTPFETAKLKSLQQALVNDRSLDDLSVQENKLSLDNSPDPLTRQLTCRALGGSKSKCAEPIAAKVAARRLVLSELVPLGALLLGSLLLIRHLWLLSRRRQSSWPELQAPPLGLVDMVLLIAGGFVVLGEVLVPLLVSPFSAIAAQSIAAPLNQAVAVVFGYAALSIPPLLILKIQLQSLDQRRVPPGGWLQWGLIPWWTALLQGGRAWLMVMPPVVATGWLMTHLIGDQGGSKRPLLKRSNANPRPRTNKGGNSPILRCATANTSALANTPQPRPKERPKTGSNPLLEMVLNGRDPMALLLLALTAVVLAPLFEETVFRGVLLPVLGRSFGRGWGVFASALVFAVAHLSIGELPPLFVLGLGLALLRLSSGRLLPCVVMHALWNGVTFFNLVLLGR